MMVCDSGKYVDMANMFPEQLQSLHGVLANNRHFCFTEYGWFIQYLSRYIQLANVMKQSCKPYRLNKLRIIRAELCGQGTGVTSDT
jgi:hypothetical protein